MCGFSQRTANTGVIPKEPPMSSLMSTSFLSIMEKVFFTFTPMVNLAERFAMQPDKEHGTIPSVFQPRAIWAIYQ